MCSLGFWKTFFIHAFCVAEEVWGRASLPLYPFRHSISCFCLVLGLFLGLFLCQRLLSRAWLSLSWAGAGEGRLLGCVGGHLVSFFCTSLLGTGFFIHTILAPTARWLLSYSFRSLWFGLSLVGRSGSWLSCSVAVQIERSSTSLSVAFLNGQGSFYLICRTFGYDDILKMYRRRFHLLSELML
jgi:hypothetical protein